MTLLKSLRNFWIKPEVKYSFFTHLHYYLVLIVPSVSPAMHLLAVIISPAFFAGKAGIAEKIRGNLL